MSIVVQNLTKEYGAQKALDNVTFSVSKGDILGFLGPNGAGKTTTMKILTCFIPQTKGYAEVCGMDVRHDSLRIRNVIGYLPESNPLYKDMYIKEYLAYVARLYKLAKPMSRVHKMIELTGLGREQHKQIGQLSKGYKQRVGIAQAMIHDPEVLIMDEPTSGLDPNQLVEIRQVIKNIGSEKAVIFSTHIMQEVEALCNRVVIINQGRIVIDDEIHALHNAMKGEITITIEFDRDFRPFSDTFKAIEEVSQVKMINDTTARFTVTGKADVRPVLFDKTVAKGLRILSMKQDSISMEDIFQQLTVNNR